MCQEDRRDRLGTHTQFGQRFQNSCSLGIDACVYQGNLSSSGLDQAESHKTIHNEMDIV